ncbi:T9SS type A sorting domain-containing protein [Chryseobacterium sp. OSA05B]|uniref:T9SS type A sorting domain-containing protein n=1 Tax=Chryseobacterium sp. OSA05B TaxID=2862650 RepID=UPI001CBB1AE1|nr:T9SS type A sorting domain-containing protein [Chryseobacterium sp. OSA05B]
MKKVLSLSAFLLVLFHTLNAQSLESDNFNSYTIGNVGTDITANSPGQGGFYTDFANGSNSEAQIVNIDAAHDKSLQLTGSANAAGTKYMWKKGLGAAWAARTAGNDILKLEFNLYTGSATGGAGRATVLIYDGTTHKTLLGAGYDYATQRAVGIANYTNTTTGVTGNILFYLEPTTYTYPANTWITLKCTFNKTTGAVVWTGPAGMLYSPAANYIPAAAGVDPFELDFVSVVNAGNTVAHITSFDNYTLTATNNVVLGTKDTAVKENSISVYPNPATDFINIQSQSLITKIEIFDAAGIKINIIYDHGKINVKDLSPGAYMMNIETNGKRFSEKFIKK